MYIECTVEDRHSQLLNLELCNRYSLLCNHALECSRTIVTWYIQYIICTSSVHSQK